MTPGKNGYIKVLSTNVGNMENVKCHLTMYSGVVKQSKHWIQIHIMMEGILKINIEMKPELYG